MVKRFNFNNLSKQEIDELIDNMYNHYYYIVDSIYERNNYSVDKEIIAEKLKSVITKYISSTDHSLQPARYIYDYMYALENHFKYIKKKDAKEELKNNAYNGDNSARKKIFMNYINKIDEKAEEIYDNYKKIGKYDSLITVNDIKQIMYLKMWQFLNNYYDKNVPDKYFSTHLNARLAQVVASINNYINNIDNERITGINNVSYSDSYFVDSIESNETLDIISTYLTDRVNIAFKYFRQGYTDIEVAEIMNLSRARINRMKNKIKEMVKDTSIR